jgi:hypothetical protein
MVRILNRFINGFLAQVTRRVLRSFGVNRSIVPIAVGVVREFNRYMQWGNKAVWRQRFNNGKRMYSEFLQWQQQVSPVYRFRGGSSTVRPHLSQETVRDKFRNPELNRVTTKIGGRRVDTSTLLVGGLGFVVIASMAGPWLAKKVNYIDPLDLRESDLNRGSSHDFDLKF